LKRKEGCSKIGFSAGKDYSFKDVVRFPEWARSRGKEIWINNTTTYVIPYLIRDPGDPSFKLIQQVKNEGFGITAFIGFPLNRFINIHFGRAGMTFIWDMLYLFE
jgi:hypothetical protein